MSKRFFSRVIFSVCVAVFFMGCKNQQQQKSADTMPQDKREQQQADTVKQEQPADDDGIIASAMITNTTPGTEVSGIVTFSQEGKKVKMKLQVTVPSKAGDTVAVHIHENSSCGNNGKDAGGHWNPTNKDHGKWGTRKFHLGDIGNVGLNEKGIGELTLETDLWTVGGEEKSDILLKSIIVHSGADDYTSQPSGNAGDRIGCGIIIKE